MECLVALTPSVRYVHADDGAQVPYYELGSGEPYVYLGTPFTSHLTARLRLPGEIALHERLQDRVRVIGMELRGTGLSQGAEVDLSVDARAEDIWSVAQHLALPPLTLHAGWHACTTAIHFAATYPDAIALSSSWAPTRMGARSMAIPQSDWPVFAC